MARLVVLVSRAFAISRSDQGTVRGLEVGAVGVEDIGRVWAVVARAGGAVVGAASGDRGGVEGVDLRARAGGEGAPVLGGLSALSARLANWMRCGVSSSSGMPRGSSAAA